MYLTVFILKLFFNLMCIDVLSAYMLMLHVPWYRQKLEEGTTPLKIELHTTVRVNVDAGF